MAWCNSIELLKLILKILLRWILLKGHVPTSITALVGNLFQKDFEKDFQNVNRIAKVKNLFLKRDFKKIFKIIFNNSIEFLSGSANLPTPIHWQLRMPFTFLPIGPPPPAKGAMCECGPVGGGGGPVMQKDLGRRRKLSKPPASSSSVEPQRRAAKKSTSGSFTWVITSTR